MTAAQQIGFEFMKAAPVVIDGEPVRMHVKLDKKYSYGEIAVRRNDDGTWSRTTRDQFQGFCGHGGPFWGSHASFDDALIYCLRSLYGSWWRLANGHAGSCCASSHIAMAKAGIKWLHQIADDHSIDMDAIERELKSYLEAA